MQGRSFTSITGVSGDLPPLHPPNPKGPSCLLFAELDRAKARCSVSEVFQAMAGQRTFAASGPATGRDEDAQIHQQMSLYGSKEKSKDAMMFALLVGIDFNLFTSC